MRQSLKYDKLKFIYFIALILVLLSFSLLFAQKKAVVRGAVYDMETHTPLSGTLIKVQKTKKVTFADQDGKFVIRGLPAGTYMLECVLATYPRYLKQIVVPSQGEKKIKIYLPQSSAAEDVFEIGGIKVEAKRDLLPREYTATTRISSGEIENLQATNLGDVLEMVPGLEKTNRLGLDRAIHANVRGSSNDALGTFGTKIILDGAPLSNNANMQMSASGTVTSSAGQGIDLRLIPADNIESIEVIRGVPSARYGDLTSGIIKVKTYSGIMSPRLKIKSNPNTSEANFGAGYRIGNYVYNLNLNYGYSERELRKEGDEFHRINGSLIVSRKFLDGKMPLKWKLFVTRLLDEEKPTDIRRTSSYNRGYTINTDWWGDYVPNNLLKYNSNLYFHYKRQNTYRSRLVEADPRAYMGELRMIGDEVSIGGRFEATRKKILSGSVHELMAGIQFQYDNNFGKGLYIDTTRNYYGQDSPKRSYSFDEVPGMTQISLYGEDRITGRLWKEYTLVLGLRYDLFKPRKINWSNHLLFDNYIDCQHGSFLSPRLGWMIYLGTHTQLRGGYGLSAKIPSMTYIFKPRESELYKLNYYSYDQSNFNLKGYYVKELKLGVDQKFGEVASLSVEAYNLWRDNEPKRHSYPFFYEINPDTFWVPTYSRYENIGWKEQAGVEVTFRTKSFRSLALTIVGNYRYTRSGTQTLSYTSNPDPIDTDGDGIFDSRDPVWRDTKDSWHKKVIIDYRLEYRAKGLGLWFQFIAQQIPLYQSKSNNPYEKGLWANYLYNYPNNWVFNFRLSKSLWWKSEISLYVNNFLDDRGVYEAPWLQQYYPETGVWGRKVYLTRNNSIFWGFEFSTKFDF
ncbi:MAG: TonB-dependent receptor [Calditrichaeota bacterium]|nr:TonB-dependent receptor [Calditrichota bacterium]